MVLSSLSAEVRTYQSLTLEDMSDQSARRNRAATHVDDDDAEAEEREERLTEIDGESDRDCDAEEGDSDLDLLGTYN